MNSEGKRCSVSVLFLGKDCLKLADVNVLVHQISWIFWPYWMPANLFLLSLQKELIKPSLFSTERFYFYWVFQVHVVLLQEGEEPYIAQQCCLGGGGLAMLSLKTSAEGAGRFPACWWASMVDRNWVRGRVNCWSMSSLYKENLSEGDDLMEWSLGWKFCF